MGTLRGIPRWIAPALRIPFPPRRPALDDIIAVHSALGGGGGRQVHAGRCVPWGLAEQSNDDPVLWSADEGCVQSESAAL